MDPLDILVEVLSELDEEQLIRLSVRLKRANKMHGHMVVSQHLIIQRAMETPKPTIVLDTAKGGYPCFGCELVLLPDEAQMIIGDEEGVQAICLPCLEKGVVKLW